MKEFKTITGAPCKKITELKNADGDIVVNPKIPKEIGCRVKTYLGKAPNNETYGRRNIQIRL